MVERGTIEAHGMGEAKPKGSGKLTTSSRYCGFVAGRLRNALLAALLVCAASPAVLAQSDAAACRDVQDTLLRLRCYDDVTKPTRPQPSASSPRAVFLKEPEPSFGSYAADGFRGPVAFPDFRGRDRGYATYRTRIRDAAKAGPNFAGYLALVQIGCGSSCSIVPVVDLRSGRVFDFPLGGEDNLSLDLRFKPGSRLVAAQWIAEGRCKREDLVWTGSAFQRGATRDLGDQDRCYELMRNE